MLDLTSTNTNDIQTAACCHLLAAVVAQAVEDLGIKPSPREYENQKNYNPDAVESLMFFDKGGHFGQFSKLIGMSAEGFMHALETGQAGPEKHPRFTDAQFRNCRQRLSWWRMAHGEEDADLGDTTESGQSEGSYRTGMGDGGQSLADWAMGLHQGGTRQNGIYKTGFRGAKE